MQEITSIQNSLIKTVHSLQQKKNRNDAGLFLVEGYKSVFEAVEYGLEVENIFVLSNFKKEIPLITQEKIYLVDEKVMKKISTTDSVPEILAIVKQKKYMIEDMLKGETPLIVVLEGIKDPGNLGTIIRTAKALNASGIVLTDDTVDIYNPKTVRASCSTLWTLPIVEIKEKASLKTIFKKFKFVATIVKEDKETLLCHEINFNHPTVLMFGSESHGISSKLASLADIYALIPMNTEVESLNLSVSVSIMLYESMRQKIGGSL